VINGAPFDVLLAADRVRPQKLEDSGAGVAGTRFVYAVGALVLWSRQLDDCRGSLDRPGGLRIAIANPAIAPYGLAARQFLERAGLWQEVGPRLVTGENISQTLQFVASGNAELGFIASAQLHAPSLPPAACLWPVPGTAHDPIAQEAMLLRHGANNESARAFLSFLNGPKARDIILKYGYSLAGDED
jgi:molybdate transport system substrate-binding protein